jgi:putative addiction module component (TIGR02574 family)
MDTAVIRQWLHNFLEVANDKKVKAIYTMVEEAIEDESVEYTDDFKAELDRRYAAYKDGSEKPVTAIESKKRIQKLLKSARK